MAKQFQNAATLIGCFFMINKILAFDKIVFTQDIFIFSTAINE